MSEDTREDARRLYDEAMSKLDEGAFEAAVALGERLKRLGFSGAFEVIALAHAGQDDLPAAVAELHEGVVVAPTVWLLWHLLGSYLGELARIDEALEAYGRALACPRVDAAFVHYHRAVALRRIDRHEDALAAAREITEGPGKRRAALLELGLLNALGRHEEALAASDAVIEEGSDDDENDREQALGERALALLAARGDRAGAEGSAKLAVGGGVFVASAAEVIRRVRERRSSGARAYRLRVRGRWLDGERHDPSGFFRVFQVVADTPEQALAYARPFEPEEARASLFVESVDADEPAVDALHGVHWASGHVLFPLRSEAPPSIA